MSVIMSVMKSKTPSKKKTADRKPAIRKPAPRAEVLPTVFTVRDMNRNTARVLAACRQHGRVVVKHRAGEAFAVTPVLEPALPDVSEAASGRARDALERLRAYREKIRSMGMRGPRTPEEAERVSMIIAGEI
jgi:hypothetical protein